MLSIAVLDNMVQSTKFSYKITLLKYLLDNGILYGICVAVLWFDCGMACESTYLQFIYINLS